MQQKMNLVTDKMGAFFKDKFQNSDKNKSIV